MADDTASRKSFRLTKQGRAIWAARRSVPLPLDYRRVLGAVEYSGSIEVIRGLLARFPSRVVDAWIAEFAAVQLIEAVPEGREPDLLALAADLKAPPMEPEDLADCESMYSLVDTSLSRLGVYIASDRALWRSDTLKKPAETTALIIEDDPEQAAVALRRLKAFGYKAESVGSAASLYGFLKQRNTDAVFLDINLPDGDGFEVLATLRRHPSHAFLPVVLLTVRSDQEDIVKGLMLGADGYITKSYGPNSLDYVLRYLLRQESTHAPAAAH